MLIRSASGLRGVVKDDFNSGIIDQYITSFILTQKITYCVLGRDGRQSGKEMSQWVVDSLTKYVVYVDYNNALSYQWFLNGEEIVGANSKSLKILSSSSWFGFSFKRSSNFTFKSTSSFKETSSTFL